ncbi:MAG: hypothetical protein AAF202_00225 [Pseudomonadota bacterium]
MKAILIAYIISGASGPNLVHSQSAMTTLELKTESECRSVARSLVESHRAAHATQPENAGLTRDNLGVDVRCLILNEDGTETTIPVVTATQD